MDFNLKTAKALGLTIPWTKAVNAIWLADQAFEGIARAIETGVGLSSVQRGKLAISELAEASFLGYRRRSEGELLPIQPFRAMVAGRSTWFSSSAAGPRVRPSVQVKLHRLIDGYARSSPYSDVA